ncbi:cytochrome b5 domain-containing protein [archaeon]|nr:MAG: cytochrome b5 domain-containing protein [archaeon]
MLVHLYRLLGGKKVYDVTKYLKKHPGGPKVLLQYAGRNADDIFELTGHSDKAREIMKSFLIGSLKVSCSSNSEGFSAV